MEIDGKWSLGPRPEYDAATGGTEGGGKEETSERTTRRRKSPSPQNPGPRSRGFDDVTGGDWRFEVRSFNRRLRSVENGRTWARPQGDFAGAIRGPYRVFVTPIGFR